MKWKQSKKLLWLILKTLLGYGIIVLNVLGYLVLFIGMTKVNLDMMLAGSLSLVVFNVPLVMIYIADLITEKPKDNIFYPIIDDISVIYNNYKYYGGNKTKAQFLSWLHRLNFNEIQRLDEAELFLYETFIGGKQR